MIDYSQLTMKTVAELPPSNAGKWKYTKTDRPAPKPPKFGPKRPSAKQKLRPFVAWDGEGYTTEEGEHRYILFGSSNGYYVQSENGEQLSTEDCFITMLKCELEHRNTYHVAFAFHYDVEMITADIPTERMQRLYEHGSIWWRNYTLTYIKGKWFTVSAQLPGIKERVVCQIWDVWSFFGGSFVKALKEYLGEDTPGYQTVVSGKGQRSQFRFDELETLIKPYWKLELDLMVELMAKFRELLHSAGLPITSWHGPGAIASYLFKSHRTYEHQSRSIPNDVSYMSQRAFAGGRFECFRIGRAHTKVYSYDINSAYPAAIAELPSLTGRWWPVKYPGEVSRYGVYHIRYRVPCERDSALYYGVPHPFFYRNKQGLVHFPPESEGWVWQPELLAAMDTGHYEWTDVLEGWEMEDDGTRPFAWVLEMYNTRQQWKAAGNQAQWALKLGLNSLYGKTAQRVGWENSPDNIPKWHQLEWAGYITSSARAKLWPVINEAFGNSTLIACETDSVIATGPLDVPVSKKLGEWSVSTHDDIVYLQNGVYMSLINGEWSWHFRGFGADSFDIQDTLNFVDNADMVTQFNFMYGKTTRFIGGRAALAVNRPDLWRTWQTGHKRMAIGLEGKRQHIPDYCPTCRYDDMPYLGRGAMHVQCAQQIDWQNLPPSYAHYLPWLTEREGVADTGAVLAMLDQTEEVTVD